MAYVKTNWVNGSTWVTQEHMNNLEDGVIGVETQNVANTAKQVTIDATHAEIKASLTTMQSTVDTLVTTIADLKTLVNSAADLAGVAGV